MNTINKEDINKSVDGFLKCLALNDEPGSILEITSIVENPFYEKKNNDAISMIFQKFTKNTSINPALPIFCFLGLMSAWCVANKATCLVPRTKKPTELDTWVMVLANSGAYKSLSLKVLSDALPISIETDRPLVEPNFVQPASNAAFVEQLKNLPDHRGFWQQDEASQFLKQVDSLTGPLASIKQTMLITKDHGNIDYATKNGGNITVRHPVLTVLMLNTIDAMKKAITEDSMLDGMFRRFTVAIADDEQSESKGFEKTALFDLDKLSDENLEIEFDRIFSQSIYEQNYTFDDACVDLYCKTFEYLWVRQFKAFMAQQQNFYRTYMMESWKYAVFHHIIYKKEGSVIGADSLQFGLRVSLYMLHSFQKFLSKSVDRSEVRSERLKFERMISYIKENETKSAFNMRAFCRKFNLKKDDAISYLVAIKENRKDVKTKLFDEIKKSKKK